MKCSIYTRYKNIKYLSKLLLQNYILSFFFFFAQSNKTRNNDYDDFEKLLNLLKI